MIERTETVGRDGVDLFVRHWAPDGPATGTVVIAHGAAEHSARYARLAEALTGAGWAVVAPDLRGHGRTAGDLARAGVCPGGWDALVGDVEALIDSLDDPVVLVGHSMGSAVARQVLDGEQGPRLAGLVLSGPFDGADDPSPLLEMLHDLINEHGLDAPSPLMAAQFEMFNSAFGETRTESDWLTRDEAEVDAYVADPWCGFSLSNGLTLGLLSHAHTIATREIEGSIPRDVPVLIVAGDRDPVGGNGEQIRTIAERYQGLGIDTTVHLYPDARHELFNETNRDEVTADLLAWLAARA